MSSPASGVLRLTRAAVLTGATVGLSLGAHVAGGGGSPTPVGLGLLTLPVLGLTLLVTGVRLRGAVVAGLVGAGQVGLHLALVVLTAPTALGPGASGPVVDHRLPHLGSGALGHHGVAGSGDRATLIMTLAHLAAAALVALLLSRGEQALWSLLVWLLPRLPRRREVRGVAVPAPLVAPRAPHSAPETGRRRCRAPPQRRAAVLARSSRGAAARLVAA